MRIYVKVAPKASFSKVEKLENGNFKIWVKSAPEKGKANKEAVNLLADYFEAAKSKIKIIAGETAQNKIIEIMYPSD